MRKFLDFWGYSDELLYKTVLTYKINLFSILVMINFTLFYYGFIKTDSAGFVSLIFTLTLLLNFVLLKLKFPYLAKILLVVIVIAQIALSTFYWFQVETRINYFLFVIAPITLFIFDYNSLKDRVAVILFNLVAVGLIALSEFVGNPDPIYTIDNELIRLIGTMNVLTTILIVTFVFFVYSKSLSLSLNNLRSKVITDPLTGILNRRAFFRIGEDLFNQKCQECIFLLFDIDHFKRVNDTYGHPVGDLVIKRITQAVSKNIRQNDVFARYGGEEFGLILRSVSKEYTMSVSDKIRMAVERESILLENGEILNKTISIGVVDAAWDATSFHDVVEMADKALYKAKEEGRNRVIIYNPL